jgi:hypothetical protein
MLLTPSLFGLTWCDRVTTPHFERPQDVRQRFGLGVHFSTATTEPESSTCSCEMVSLMAETDQTSILSSQQNPNPTFDDEVSRFTYQL